MKAQTRKNITNESIPRPKAYRLNCQESIAAGVRRIAREVIRGALEDLTAPETSPGERIHESRKKLKRLRALLRLVRSEMGEAYRAENAAARDAGRRLSGYRDADAVLETFDKLREQYRHRLDRRAAQALRRSLAQSRRSLLPEDDSLAPEVSAVASELKKIEKRVDSWSIEGNGFEAIRPNLKLTYARARDGFRAASKDPTSENVHEWRKRVKYHWLHTRLIRETWPELFRPLRQSLKELSTLLGDIHDLDVLRGVLEEPVFLKGTPSSRAWIKLIEKRRAELLDEAQASARRLFVEKPKAFGERIEGYWAASTRLPNEASRR